MNDASAVDVVDRFNYRLKISNRIRERKATPGGDAFSEGLPFDVLHDDAGLAVVFKEIIKRRDVVVLKPGLYSSFIQKPLDELRAGGCLIQYLDRNHPAYLRMYALIDLTHSAFAQFSD